MDAFVKLNPEERRIFFEGTATPRNMQAQIVEKDFWVCWTLKELFDLSVIGEHLIFKGGTSLSKVFKVIERFSEDIDVSIDRGFLGFGGANEPEAGASNKEKQRRIEALKTACQQKIATELLPALESAIRSKVRRAEKWSLRSDEDDPDKQTLLFDYPTSFAPEAAGYLRRAVKIEMGARADHWPLGDEAGHAVCSGAVSPGISRTELRREGFVGGTDVLGEGNNPARGVLSSGGQADAGALFPALLRRLRVDPKGRIE